MSETACFRRRSSLSSTNQSRETLQNGQRMGEEDTDASNGSLRLMENSQLPQNHSSVVIDSLSCQAVIGTEGVHTTKRDLHRPSRCRETTPWAQLRTTYDHFENNGLSGYVSAHDLNTQVRQRPHKLPIELTHLITAFVMLIPGFIIIARALTQEIWVG